MPIEFRCAQCGKLLRTPDGSGGQQAKCPACGAVVVVPETSPTPAPADGDQSPFGASPGYDAGDSLNPYQAPAETTAAASPFGPAYAAVGIRPTKIRFGDVFGETWKIFAEQWPLCVGAALLWLIIVVFVLGTLLVGVLLIWAATRNVETVIAAAVLAGCVGMIGVTWITVGRQLMFIKIARGLDAGVGDLFAGGPYFLRYLGGTVLYQLAVSAIMGVCALPLAAVGLAIGEELALAGLILGGVISLVPLGIFILTFYQFSYLIIDQNLGVLESFSASRRVTSGNRLIMLGIIVVMAVLGSVINQFTCNLGVLVVTPFTLLLYAVMYVMMIGQPTAAQRAQAPVAASSPFVAS